MSVVKQIGAVTLMNLSSIPHRMGSSSVIVIGIAGVVGVILAVFGMTQSMSHALVDTGRADRAIVLRSDAQNEISSSLAADAVATIKNAPGVLGQACTIIGEAGANILNLKMSHRQSDFFDVDFDVEVVDARHLTHIAAALRACPSVETVDRVKG